jgi:hypothetical protein
MNRNNSLFKLSLFRRTLAPIVAAVLLLSPSLAGIAAAQTSGTIEAGVTIPVRTLEDIQVNRSDGRVFAGMVDRDVPNRRGAIALQRGTMVELMVRHLAEDDYILDLDSVLVNGRRLAVNSEDSVVFDTDDRFGANSRTGRFVGGGAIVGAIIGAITGGGKGAAIGGGVGAAAGAGTQALTRGRQVIVPAESVVTFQLEQPLRVSAVNRGVARNGSLYRPGYGARDENTAAYDAGLRAGRADRQVNRAFFARTNPWRGQDARDYREGYERGYAENPRRQVRNDRNIQVGADRFVRWSGPPDSRVYFQMDNTRRQLFSNSSIGAEPAPWISTGHRYVFTLVDRNGREIARDEYDLRRSSRASN